MQSVRPWKTECQKQRHQQQRRPEGYSRKKCGRRAKRKRDERNDQCAPFRVPTTPAEKKRRHRPAERPDNRFVIDREVSEQQKQGRAENKSAEARAPKPAPCPRGKRRGAQRFPRGHGAGLGARASADLFS